MNEFINKLRDNLTVKNERNSDVLNVTYSSHSAYESALIVNTLMAEYEEMDKNAASNEMKELREFLGKQLKDKEKEIKEFDAKLKDFQEQQRIYGEKADKANLLLNQLSIVESDYYDSRSKKNVLINRKKDFENQLTNDEKDFSQQIGNTLNAQLSKIRQELSAVEAEYILTKSIQGDSHPAVMNLKSQIDKLKKALNDETEKYINQKSSVADPIEYRQSMIDSMIVLDARISGYDYKMRELDGLIIMYNDSLSSLPEKYLKYSQYQRDKIILDETYSLMKTKFAEAEINENSGRSKIREIDKASPFEYSSSPNKKFILLICIILTFSIGAGGIFLIEFLDSTVKSIDEIERRGLSILSIIPSIGQHSKGRKKKKGYKLNLKLNTSDKIERRLLTHEDPKSPISEAYRSLRTSLMFDTNKETELGKIILVSSPGPGEGKTTTVANLAITYANMGKKTILVDADLRKPVLHQMFKSTKNTGLTNLLSNSELDINDLVIDTGVENFKVLTSGIIPPNPSEMLASDKMEILINKLKKDFDIILFDAPPLIAVTDAFVITKFVDKFLLVIRASKTQKGALERTLVNCNNINNTIDGVIFNAVNESNTYGGGYYYNYYQYYYGSDK